MWLISKPETVQLGVFFKPLKQLKTQCCYRIILTTTTTLFNVIDFQGIYLQQRGDIFLLFVRLCQATIIVGRALFWSMLKSKMTQTAYYPEPLNFQQTKKMLVKANRHVHCQFLELVLETNKKNQNIFVHVFGKHQCYFYILTQL